MRYVQKRTSSDHHETSHQYVGLVAQLCPRHRVIIDKDVVQWILQKRDAQRSGQPRWKGVAYFRTREALVRVSRRLCSHIDPAALATLAALPEVFGGAS